jgi:hypothetical protein
MTVDGKPLAIRVGVDYGQDQVVIEFQEDVRWISMTEANAIFIAETILDKVQLLREYREKDRGENPEPTRVGKGEDNNPGIPD